MATIATNWILGDECLLHQTVAHLDFDPVEVDTLHMILSGRPIMASFAYARPLGCHVCDLLRENFKQLLDAYREACLRQLELGGMDAASTKTRREYRECEEARNQLVRHRKENGCE